VVLFFVKCFPLYLVTGIPCLIENLYFHKNLPMKITLSILILACTVQLTTAQEDDTRYFYSDYTFEKGRTELMYGNNVVLRADQNPTSKALDTLKIGDPVTIIKKGETTSDLNGQPSYWYKVKTKNKTGYVLGGWISLDHREVNGKIFLVIYAKRDDQLYARTRVLAKDKSYYGHEISLNTYMITFEVKESHGLKGVENIFIITMHPEACGVVGGEAILFDTGEHLKEVLRTSCMSEAGLFWFSESVEFKDPDYWEDNVAYFSREQGEYMDDSMDWTQTLTNTIKITWDGEKFTPDVSKFNFELAEDQE
jgi:hypothetical protein